MSQVKCSFCGKASDDVLKIIAGPGVYMCDECIILSMSILLDSPVSSGQIEVFTDEEVIRKALKYDKKPGISWCKACRSFMFDLRSDKTPNVFVEHQCFKMLEDEKKTTRTLNTDIPKTDKSQLILKKRIESILPQFSEKEAKIISLRLGSDDRSPKTLDEVAELLDIEKDEILDLERLLLFKLHGQQ